MASTDWSLTRLGDVAALYKGASYQSKHLNQEGPLLLGLGTILPGGGIQLSKARPYSGQLKSIHMIRPGEIYIALTDLTQEGIVLGSPAQVPLDTTGEFAVTLDVARLEVKDSNSLNRRFAYYLLQSRQARTYFRGVATGTTVRRVAVKDAEDYTFLLPPLTQQRAIADLLGTLDDKIELSRRISETLEAIALEIFKDWFEEFGPTRAKAEGRAPYLSSELWELFPATFAESGQPEGWTAGTIHDLFSLQRGFDLPTARRQSGDYPVIAASGFHGYHSESRVAGPGVVTGRSGVLGRVFLILEDFWPLNTTLWIKQFHTVGPHYAYQLLRSLDVSAFNTGSAVPSLNRNHVHLIPTIVPSPATVKAYEDTVQPMFQAIFQREQEITTLSQIRDALLPRLISGELRIPEAERLVSEVA